MRKWLCGIWLTSVLACLPALAQNDLMLSAPLPAPPSSVPSQFMPSTPPPATQAVPAPQVTIIQAAPSSAAPVPPPGPLPAPLAAPLPGAAAQVRIALLLPLKSAAFRAAAEAVQQGFMLACRRDPDPRLSLFVRETGDDPRDVLAAFEQVQSEADIVVGPLTRSGVSAIASRARIDKPTLALAHAEPQGERELTLPPHLLPIGLSVEEEARQLAQQLAQEHPSVRAWIISGPSAWQRRAARAFELQWRQLRQLSERLEIITAGAALDINGLQQLRRRLETEQPGLVFAALDTDQASQLREALGTQVPMAGTSLLNPLPSGDWPTASRRPELDGVRLLDLPWLVQPDHPAVMAYRAGAPVARRSAELERLYALGLDACRLAREIAAGNTRFELDGVSGRLQLDLNSAAARFTRQEVPAVYQDGAVVAESFAGPVANPPR